MSFTCIVDCVESQLQIPDGIQLHFRNTFANYLRLRHDMLMFEHMFIFANKHVYFCKQTPNTHRNCHAIRIGGENCNLLLQNDFFPTHGCIGNKRNNSYSSEINIIIPI